MTDEEALAAWQNQIKVLDREVTEEIGKALDSYRERLEAIEDERRGLTARTALNAAAMLLPGKRGRKARAELLDLKGRVERWATRRDEVIESSGVRLGKLALRRKEIKALRTESIEQATERGRGLLEMQAAFDQALKEMPAAGMPC